jgi:virginiamycin B lyase
MTAQAASDTIHRSLFMYFSSSIEGNDRLPDECMATPGHDRWIDSIAPIERSNREAQSVTRDACSLRYALLHVTAAGGWRRARARPTNIRRRHMTVRNLIRRSSLSLGVGLALLATQGMSGTSGTSESRFAGKVLDEQGQPVAAAIVSARDTKTDVTTAGITDASGRFSLPRLAVGGYEIEVSKEGFRSASSRVRLPLHEDWKARISALPVFPMAQLRDEEIIRYMPDDDPKRTALGGGGGSPTPVAEQSEKTLVRDRCIRCHSLALVMRQGRTPAEWDQLVARMGTYPLGASHPAGYTLTGNPMVKGKILDYLKNYLPPNETVTSEIEKTAKENDKPEIPVGSGVVYTEWKVPTPIALPHTAVPDNHGHVWFTEWGIGKIGELDLATNKIREYPIKTPGGNPHGITVGPDGIVWFTIPEGNLGRLDPRTGTVEEFVPPKEVPTGLNVIVARDGMVWYAAPGGITRFDPKTHEFHTVVAEAGLGAPYAVIQSRTDENVFWFCVEGQKRAGFVNVKTGKATILHTRLPGPKRPRIDSRGRVFFGYYEGGAVGMIDPETMTLTDFPLPYRGTAYAIHVDDHDKVWVASYERGSFIRLDPDTREMIEYPWPSPGGIVRDIWPDQDGNLWFVFFAWTHNTLVRAERPDSKVLAEAGSAETRPGSLGQSGSAGQ